MEILNDQDFSEIGYIRKSHGYKGHLKIQVEDSYIEDFISQRYVFLQIDGYKVPFEIEESQLDSDHIIKLATIDNPEVLKNYPHKRLYLLTRDIKQAASDDAQDGKSQLIGMHIFDITLGDLGPIIRIDPYPQQDMAILIKDKTEVLIPLHEQLISSISIEDKKIVMDLPEGLV